ncbi:uncharacterized protein C8R40DRAFT_107900 [Lentinula edodes]|uniref:uncharacterized protein n=1 Tax=Lentinula edodes TaxID=5353 RepID=UPI001E8E988A|nr:uncharacterized protein C8R40DRAFT_107900 [Lentinula edodes]KAH7876645.1 hypothetical protein C8R40DRAFT_107900 [Lentinula edodes]
MRFNATVYISLVVFLASASVSGSPISVSFHRLQITFILFSRFPLQSENTQEVDATITHNTGAPGQEHIWTLMRQVFEEKHGWTRTQANHLNLHMVHDDSVSIRQDGKTFFAEGMLGVTRKCKGVVGPEGGNTLQAFPSRRSRKKKTNSSGPVEQYHIPGAFPTQPPMLLPL